MSLYYSWEGAEQLPAQMTQVLQMTALCNSPDISVGHTGHCLSPAKIKLKVTLH